MTLILDDAAVRRVFDWTAAGVSIEAAYGGSVDTRRFPLRSIARGDSGWLRTLSGVCQENGLMGGKLIAANTKRHKVSYLIPLFDQESAELVALLDGSSITGYRTAVTSAVAADVLTQPGPVSVAVIGSGFEAHQHVRALASRRRIDKISVFSPRAESRMRFVKELSDLVPQIHPAETAQEAIEGTTLIICAARSRDESPTLHADWLSPGMTVVSIGSTVPEQREVSEGVIERVDTIVADVVDEVLDDTGDFIAAEAAGIDFRTKTRALGDVLSGRASGRTHPSEIILYKSVGSPVQDLAVAGLCLQRARDQGLGTPMPVTFRPVQK